MYSALKRDGQPLYKLARGGRLSRAQVRDVTIHHVDVAFAREQRKRDSSDPLQQGTYVRSLAEDLLVLR